LLMRICLVLSLCTWWLTHSPENQALNFLDNSGLRRIVSVLHKAITASVEIDGVLQT